LSIDLGARLELTRKVYDLSRWSEGDREAIGARAEIQIITLSPEGRLRKPVRVWIVDVAGEFYVRSWRGTSTRWFSDAHERPHGRVRVGDVEREITFAAVSPNFHSAIDAAYRMKYGRYGRRHVEIMTSHHARLGTLRLIPVLGMQSTKSPGRLRGGPPTADVSDGRGRKHRHSC
jgi:hypothetical protein